MLKTKFIKCNHSQLYEEIIIFVYFSRESTYKILIMIMNNPISFALRSCIYVHALNQVWKKTATPRRWRRSRRCWTRRSSCKPWTPLEVSPLSGGSSNLFGRMRMTFSSSFIVSSSSQEIIYIYQPAYVSQYMTKTTTSVFKSKILKPLNLKKKNFTLAEYS